MKADVLKEIQSVYKETMDNIFPPIIVAFQNKSASGTDLMIIDMAVFVINAVFFASAFWVTGVPVAKTLAVINSLFVLVAKFFCKKAVYNEVSRVVIDLKDAQTVNTKVINLVNIVKFLGWVLFAFTLSWIGFLGITNSINYTGSLVVQRFLDVCVTSILIVYGILDAVVWNFFSINNDDIHRLARAFMDEVDIDKYILEILRSRGRVK